MQEEQERITNMINENTESLMRMQNKYKFGKWEKLKGTYCTPGGEPVYVCGFCGGSQHLFGVEFRKRKMVCDRCGAINSYPWEETLEEEEN